MPSAKILSEVNRNLLAVPASVGISRDLIAGFAMAEGLVRYAERATPIISELATNALEVSGPTDMIGIYAAKHPNCLLIGAADLCPDRRPTPANPVSTLEEIDVAEGEGFGGWGLHMVEYLADKVWVEPTIRDGREAKWVCAEIHLPDEGARHGRTQDAQLPRTVQGTLAPGLGQVAQEAPAPQHHGPLIHGGLPPSRGEAVTYRPHPASSWAFARSGRDADAGGEGAQAR